MRRGNELLLFCRSLKDDPITKLGRVVAALAVVVHLLNWTQKKFRKCFDTYDDECCAIQTYIWLCFIHFTKTSYIIIIIPYLSRSLLRFIFLFHCQSSCKTGCILPLEPDITRSFYTSHLLLIQRIPRASMKLTLVRQA